MKFVTAVAMTLVGASGIIAQEGCNEKFPDLSKAAGLNDTAKATAQKCEDTAKKVPSCAVSTLILSEVYSY